MWASSLPVLPGTILLNPGFPGLTGSPRSGRRPLSIFLFSGTPLAKGESASHKAWALGGGAINSAHKVKNLNSRSAFWTKKTRDHTPLADADGTRLKTPTTPAWRDWQINQSHVYELARRMITFTALQMGKRQ